MSTAPDKSDLWRYVPAADARIPTEPIGVGRVRKGFRAFFRGLTDQDTEKESPLEPSDELSSLSGERLENAMPTPDWSRAASVLEQRLRPWLEMERPTTPVVVYVAPPYAGREEILRCWASEQEAGVVDPPETKHILTGDLKRYLRQWPKRSPWVLPQLEKAFFRQPDGLDLVRDLLARVLTGALGRGIIGCDSWAWQFLQRVWLGRPSFTITAQPFDAVHMQRFFGESILDHCEADVTFRRADTGDYLLSREMVSADDTSTPDSFWRRLAAHSRGNPGVAGAYWQRALRTLPENEQVNDDTPESTGRSEKAEQERLRRRSVWVQSWEDLELPIVPKDAGETVLFVLHALLLHGGLPVDRLSALLPSAQAAVIEALLFLRETGLVSEDDKTGEWRVTPYGYPAVRSALVTNEFLHDPF